VNIDHVATLRQARVGREPEPVAAALAAQSAGCSGITVHLRADRRHIQDRDLRILKEVLSLPLNVECAATPEALESVIGPKPHMVTLVPETREELTTTGGLDAIFLQAPLRQIIRELKASDIRVSLFIDPSRDQVMMAAKLEADAVELNTGVYSDIPFGSDPGLELGRIREAAKRSANLGLRVLAGHGLNMRKLESRPSRERAWEYVFWIDLDGDITEPPMRAALDDLGEVTTMVRRLGSYPSPDA